MHYTVPGNKLSIFDFDFPLRSLRVLCDLCGLTAECAEVHAEDAKAVEQNMHFLPGYSILEGEYGGGYVALTMLVQGETLAKH